MKFIFYPKKKIVNILFFLVLFLSNNSTMKAQFTINDTFGDLTECDTMTRGIYIVWWDKDFNYTDQIDILLDTMLSYRTICLDDLSMDDPPNALDGYYYNVYIHGNDFFAPLNWGNGQGTDNNGYPFLTLPSGLISNWNNTAHETFHIFQYNANSPGFAYSGDSQWYIEASANWFAARQNPSILRRFVEAESLVRLPHVPLWLSFGNFPTDYPQNWQRYVHQYALALHLYYLTDVVGIDEDIITSGLYGQTNEKPQEYMFNQIGGSNFRQYFIDWAAHMTNDFDFIPADQAATNLSEWNTYADPVDDNEFIATYDNEGTNGWVSPEDEKVTHAWSFNTYKLLNSETTTYTFEVNGSANGSYGDDAYFQGKILVQNSVTGSSFYDLNMSNSLQGSFTLDVTAEDTEIYFVIASMPEVFEDNNSSFQKFAYEMRISIEDATSVFDASLSRSKLKSEVGRFNLLGQKIDRHMEGFHVIIFDDGSCEKIYLFKD
jgi:hypothetical protein